MLKKYLKNSHHPYRLVPDTNQNNTEISFYPSQKDKLIEQFQQLLEILSKGNLFTLPGFVNWSYHSGSQCGQP